VEISVVRKRVQGAIVAARDRAQRRRSQTAEAEKAFESFLGNVAIPIAKQVVAVLKAESRAFTVFTPGGGLRIASDRNRDDYIELTLDTTSECPQVIGRVSRTYGSRTLNEERAVRPDTPPHELTEDDVLTFLVDSLQPWLER
jgi:hypothetical protein